MVASSLTHPPHLPRRIQRIRRRARFALRQRTGPSGACAVNSANSRSTGSYPRDGKASSNDPYFGRTSRGGNAGCHSPCPVEARRTGGQPVPALGPPPFDVAACALAQFCFWPKADPSLWDWQTAESASGSTLKQDHQWTTYSYGVPVTGQLEVDARHTIASPDPTYEHARRFPAAAGASSGSSLCTPAQLCCWA